MLSKGKILIVEDEELFSLSLRFILERFGYHVLSTVNQGDMVIQSIIDDPPDIILMDIKLLGKIDGIEAAEKVQNRVNIPIVFVSALDEEKVIGRITISNYAYLKKPFEGGELIAIIEDKLQENTFQPG